MRESQERWAGVIPGVTHLAVSTLGHQAAAWEGRGQSLGLMGLYRTRMGVMWVWNCKGMKTTNETDESIGRDVATTRLGTWSGPETASNSCVLPMQHFQLLPREIGGAASAADAQGCSQCPARWCHCTPPLAAEILPTRPVFTAGVTQLWHLGLFQFLEYFMLHLHPSCSREKGRTEQLGEFLQGLLQLVLRKKFDKMTNIPFSLKVSELFPLSHMSVLFLLPHPRAFSSA